MVLASSHGPEGKVEGESCQDTNYSKENGKSRLEQTQEDVEEVKEIMLDNLDRVQERSGKLHELEDRADVLMEKSKGFEKTCNQVKNKKRWENKKMKMIFIGIGVAVAIIIIITFITIFSTKGE